MLKLVLQLCFTALPVVALYVALTKRPRRPFYRSVAILVLGDIGRSPRMMYHAESFAQHEFETFVVGYKGAEPTALLRSLPHVHFIHLTPSAAFISHLPRAAFLLVAPLKVLFQVLVVLHALFFRLPYTPQYICVQNPPSIPTLALVQLFAKIRGCRIIIDWHNLGYSILAIRLGENSLPVRIAKWFEQTFGRWAYAHLFVTQAMKEHLSKTWGLQGRMVVFYDRPPRHFHESSPSETHELFLNLPPFTPLMDSFFPKSSRPDSTAFTEMSSAPRSLVTNMATGTPYAPALLPVLRPDRPALVITSTSWTPDEDISLLLKALVMYEHRARAVNGPVNGPGDARVSKKGRLPKLLMIVTGRGELRDRYMREVEILETEGKWEWVRCRSVWMSSKDYPILLGSADLGISLHSSSSALDLPMKVVDMFGCGLPVCALDFACLHELVQDGENGVIFHSADELAYQFESLLTSFPEHTQLDRLRDSLREKLNPPTYPNTLPSSTWTWGTWTENWNRVVRPLVDERHTLAG